MDQSLHTTDLELLKRLDSKAWEAFYNAESDNTYRVLSCTTKASKQVVEDLNQEVWLAAIEKIQALDESKGSARDWILGIARFKGLSHLRRIYRSKATLIFEANEEFEASNLEIGRQHEQAREERMAILTGSLISLPELWRVVLQKKYELGMSVKDIAQNLDTTPKSVESILSRSRQRLRELYEETLRLEDLI